MDITVKSKQVELIDSRTFTLRLTEHNNRIVPLTHDIKYIDMMLSDDIIAVNIIIGGTEVIRYQRDTPVPIYTSLLKYANVDLQFVFNNENYEPITLTKTEAESYPDEYAIIFDEYDYHEGQLVTYKDVTYEGKRKTVTIPKITLKLVPGITFTGNVLKVPITQYVTNIDREYKASLELSNYNLAMVDETSGFVTNYLIYRGGLAGFQHIF